MNTKLNFKQSLMAGLTAAGVASIINALLFLTFKAMGFITDDIFIKDDQVLTLVPIILSSVMPTILASIVFFIIEKYSTNGWVIFRILSIILLVLSFMNPFMGIKNVTVEYAVSLNIMHITVAGAVLFFINKSKKSLTQITR